MSGLFKNYCPSYLIIRNRGKTTLVPLVNNRVFVNPDNDTPLSDADSNTSNLPRNQGFYSTDDDGYFNLDTQYKNKIMKVYLASNNAIIANCYSRVEPTDSGFVVLGERGSSCPITNCD